MSDPAQAGEGPLDRLPDDQMPVPEPAGARRPRPPVPRDLAETEDPDQDLPGAGTQDATQSLAHMTRMRPFLYLHRSPHRLPWTAQPKNAPGSTSGAPAWTSPS